MLGSVAARSSVLPTRSAPCWIAPSYSRADGSSVRFPAHSCASVGAKAKSDDGNVPYSRQYAARPGSTTRSEPATPGPGQTSGNRAAILRTAIASGAGAAVVEAASQRVTRLGGVLARRRPPSASDDLSEKASAFLPSYALRARLFPMLPSGTKSPLLFRMQCCTRSTGAAM